MDNKISEWLNNFKNNDKDISKKIEKLSIKNQKLITANRKLQLEKENIELKHQELILKMQGYQKDVDNLYEKVEEYTIRYGEICKSDNNFDFEYDKNIIDSLNSKLKNPYSYDQTRAIAYDMQRHLRIVAGAGAGKTETICGKAIYLRDVERINGSEILVTTFTKKAQLEIEERIIKLEPGSSTDIKVGTLNAWFQQEYNLLKKQYLRSEDLIIDGNIDDLKYHQLLNKLIQEYDLEKLNTIDDKKLSEKLSYWNNVGYDNETIIKIVKETYSNTIDEGVADRFKMFLNKLDIGKSENKIAIFDDYPKALYNLLNSSNAALKIIKAKYKYLIIDEFQDVNKMQMNIINLICKENTCTKLIIVGDDDQSIYGFRGSDPSFINNFDLRYDTHTINLMTNYRSGSKIVHKANKLISNNEVRIVKDMVPNPENKENGTVSVVDFEDSLTETNWIVNKIIQMLKEPKTCYRDFGILFPTTSKIDEVVLELQLHKLPFVNMSDNNKSILNNQDFKNLYSKLSNIYHNKVGTLILKKYMLHMLYIKSDEIVDNQIDDWNYISKLLSSKYKLANLDSIKVIYKEIDNQYNDKDHPIYLLTKEWLNLSVPLSNISLEDSDSIKNICKKCKTIKNLINIKETINILKLENKKNITLYNEKKLDAICLMSIHGSKGLSFSHTFVKEVYDGSLPSAYTKKLNSVEINELINKGNPPTIIEEQRRLMYVAMTRAEKSLFITYPRIVGGKYTKESIFIKELR